MMMILLLMIAMIITIIMIKKMVITAMRITISIATKSLSFEEHHERYPLPHM